MKHTVFLVEDDRDITQLLSHHLQAAGFAIRTFLRAESVISDAEQSKPSLFILDIMVPGGDGLDLCKRIRQTPGLAMVPIIFLTARAAEADRVLGLELGGDDYISKPFSPREVVLRIKAILRRGAAEQTEEPMTAGSITIDPARHKVSVGKNDVDLTSIEFRLLRMLMQRRGRVQERDRLLNEVWGYESVIDTRTVDTHIRRLREKLGKAGGQIETVRGFGYRFREA